jgi:hypothetical protein
LLTRTKHSWGTKGDTQVQTDLGVVKTTDGKVDVALPSDEKDINEAYGDAWELLQSKPPKHKGGVDADTRIQDKYKTIRTNVVLAWTLTNVRNHGSSLLNFFEALSVCFTLFADPIRSARSVGWPCRRHPVSFFPLLPFISHLGKLFLTACLSGRRVRVTPSL